MDLNAPMISNNAGPSPVVGLYVVDIPVLLGGMEILFALSRTATGGVPANQIIWLPAHFESFLFQPKMEISFLNLLNRKELDHNPF